MSCIAHLRIITDIQADAAAFEAVSTRSGALVAVELAVDGDIRVLGPNTRILAFFEDSLGRFPPREIRFFGFGDLYSISRKTGSQTSKRLSDMKVPRSHHATRATYTNDAS
jgi:hypothetical protein